MYYHKETVVRTVILVIAWLNMLLSHYGLNTIPVLNEVIVADILAGIATIWTWFKNNYVTIKKGKVQHDTLQEKGID